MKPTAGFARCWYVAVDAPTETGNPCATPALKAKYAMPPIAAINTKAETIRKTILPFMVHSFVNVNSERDYRSRL